MKFRALALTAFAAGAIGLAGCGGDDASGDASGADALALLTKTFDGSSGPIKSATVDLNLDGKITGKDSGDGELALQVKVNETKGGKTLPPFAITASIKGKSGETELDESFGATFNENRLFVNYDGEDYDAGDEFSKSLVAEAEKQVEETRKEAGNEDIVQQLGLEPQTWLIDPKVEGTEKIGDAETYKITGEVDIKKMVPDVLEAAKKAEQIAPTGSSSKKSEVPEVSQEQLDKAADQIEKLQITVWTGKDDTILRKLEVGAAVNDKDKDKIEGTLGLTITNVNQVQDIKTPSKTKPIAELMPKLGGLGALLGGGLGGGSGAGAGMGDSATGAPSDEFVECVQRAQGDEKKLNACQAQLQ